MKLAFIAHCMLPIIALASVEVNDANCTTLTVTPAKSSITVNLHSSTPSKGLVTHRNTLKGSFVSSLTNGMSTACSSTTIYGSSTFYWSSLSTNTPHLSSHYSLTKILTTSGTNLESFPTISPYKTSVSCSSGVSSRPVTTSTFTFTGTYQHTLTTSQWLNSSISLLCSTMKASVSSNLEYFPVFSTKLTASYPLPTNTTSISLPPLGTGKPTAATSPYNTKATSLVRSRHKHMRRSDYKFTTLIAASSSPTAEPFETLNKRYTRNMQDILSKHSPSCSKDNVFIRRSWSKLSDDDRKSYIKAVSCIHGKKPPMFHPEGIYDKNSRYRIDDIIQMRTRLMFRQLFTGSSLFYNRYYLYIYETALRDECHYEGYLPYWDFSEYAHNITQDPIFSNGDISMGGNGLPLPGGHGWVQVNYYNLSANVPPGTGGGCIFNPPFHSSIVRYGLTLKYDKDVNKTSIYPWPNHDSLWEPVFTLDPDYPNPEELKSPFWLNERCITRDLNPRTSQFLNISRVEHDLSCSNIKCFQERMNGKLPTDPYPFNLINTARFSVGGLQLDPMAGPTDPIFWLMSANLDRIFSIWQGQDPAARFNQTWGNAYPFGDDYRLHDPWLLPVSMSTNLTLYGLDTGFKPPTFPEQPGWTWFRTIAELTNTLGDYFCYYYE